MFSCNLLSEHFQPRVGIMWTILVQSQACRYSLMNYRHRAANSPLAYATTNYFTAAALVGYASCTPVCRRTSHSLLKWLYADQKFIKLAMLFKKFVSYRGLLTTASLSMVRSEGNCYQIEPVTICDRFIEVR